MAQLSPYRAPIKEEAERFGGTLEQFMGDAVVAVFGALASHEDDAERAGRSPGPPHRLPRSRSSRRAARSSWRRLRV